MKYIGNGFSPKMLNPKTNPQFKMERITYEEIEKVKEKEELINAIGHQTIADHLKMIKNRINILLEKNDTLYVVYQNPDDEYDYWKVIIYWGEINDICKRLL